MKVSKIVFFCIPAYGHTNPTIEVVRELVNMGNEVRYYSFEEFRPRLEEAGAQVIVCDQYLPPAPDDLDQKVGKDFSALIGMVVDTTLNMDEVVCEELRAWKPDCIVSDSVCFWGKLFAMKMDIPYICSTTTFAFNRYTARLMKQGFSELFLGLLGMPKINKKMKLLRENGYPIKNMLQLLQNDNDTDTIVYTSKEFQPMVETFSNQYAFVGPSVKKASVQPVSHEPTIYISLGTVNNRGQLNFYKNCMEALKDTSYQVILSIGDQTEVTSLGEIPKNISVKQKVDQINVLVNTDVFLTHCGMNSANESMYFGVPCVLYPQQSEQGAVATRLEELGAGIRLKGGNPEQIREAIETVLTDPSYKAAAKKIQKSFHETGGPKAAAQFIQTKMIEA